MNARRSIPRGFTLLEILIATVLLTTMIGTLLASFRMARQWSADSLTGGPSFNLIRERMEELQEEVRFDTWNTGPLRIVAGNLTTTEALFPPPLNGVNYTRETRVYDGPAGMQYRKAEVKVKW